MMKNAKLTILQINDTHGYLEPHPELFWRGDKAEYRLSGGYARLVTIFKQVRLEQNGAVIALDNGDTSSVNASLPGTVVVVEKRAVLPMNTPLPDHHRCTEHLAVERTFLAWVRTSIAIISLGFVVAKFSVWLRELAGRLDPQVQIHSSGMSLPIGVGMMAFGGILTVLAAWHCHVVHRAVERGEVRANRGLIVAVTVAVAVLAVLMIVYMLLTARSQ